VFFSQVINGENFQCKGNRTDVRCIVIIIIIIIMIVIITIIMIIILIMIKIIILHAWVCQEIIIVLANRK